MAATAGTNSRERLSRIEDGFRIIVASSYPNRASGEPSTDAAIGGPDPFYSKP